MVESRQSTPQALQRYLTRVSDRKALLPVWWYAESSEDIWSGRTRLQPPITPILLTWASLRDFLNLQAEYRGVQLNYVNLVGSYLTSAAQLNQALGREVIQ